MAGTDAPDPGPEARPSTDGNRRRRPGTPFQHWLGLTWSLPDDDGVVVELPMRDDLRGPAGSLEGGVVATIVDVAGASAAARAAGCLVATQSVSLSYLAPGRIGPVRATARAERVGPRDAVCEVRVVDVGREDRLMAVGLVTLRLLRDDP